MTAGLKKSGNSQNGKFTKNGCQILEMSGIFLKILGQRADYVPVKLKFSVKTFCASSNFNNYFLTCVKLVGYLIFDI